MLVSRFPYPLEKGDKLRAFHQLKELSKHFDVTLFALTNHEVASEHYQIVKEHCSEIIVHQQSLLQKGWNIFRSALNGNPYQVGYFYSSKGQNKIKQLLKEDSFNHVYCQLIRMSEYVKHEHTIPKTIDYQDAFSAGIQRRVSKQPFHKKWIFKSEAKRLKRYESLMFDFFENRTIISKQDRQLIMHPNSQEIVCIPNGIDESFFEELKQEKTHDFVFVGNMSYAPNVEAIVYISEKILPMFPEKTLLISGSSPSKKVKSIAAENSQIELTGWVDDIRSSYAAGKIFLAPMMIGTGMQNKLLEAMAIGVPCITTPLANNPIGTKENSEILVASTPEEFKSAIETLFQDSIKYAEIQGNARAFVEQNHHWSETTKRLVELINSTKY
ncbi:MAG: glycosyltransferase [Crocinitomicaceae bacterium]|nr:glycosyltransferase [Crocinitomicaceae bacterium]